MKIQYNPLPETFTRTVLEKSFHNLHIDNVYAAYAMTICMFLMSGSFTKIEQLYHEK